MGILRRGTGAPRRGCTCGHVLSCQKIASGILHHCVTERVTATARILGQFVKFHEPTDRVTIECQIVSEHLLQASSGTNFGSARLTEETTRRLMSNIKHAQGTLFMALEEGAPWPQFIQQLRRTAANVQAVVQAPGEPVELFVARVLERWNAVVRSSAPPHRFVLGTNECWDAAVARARLRLAHSAMNVRDNEFSELILWCGNNQNADSQGRLLSLAGALVEGKNKAARHVRVLFREPSQRIGGRPVSRQPQSTVLRVA